MTPMDIALFVMVVQYLQVETRDTKFVLILSLQSLLHRKFQQWEKWDAQFQLITNCETYNNNLPPSTCAPTKILSVGLMGCANEISYCLTYNDDMMCDTYAQPKIWTVGKCATYNEDLTCATCDQSKNSD